MHSISSSSLRLPIAAICRAHLRTLPMQLAAFACTAIPAAIRPFYVARRLRLSRTRLKWFQGHFCSNDGISLFYHYSAVFTTWLCTCNAENMSHFIISVVGNEETCVRVCVFCQMEMQLRENREILIRRTTYFNAVPCV